MRLFVIEHSTRNMRYRGCPENWVRLTSSLMDEPTAMLFQSVDELIVEQRQTIKELLIRKNGISS